MFRIQVLHQHRPDLRSLGTAYIRLLLPLTYPTNSNVFTVNHSLDYRPADVVIIERLWKEDVSMGSAIELVSKIRADGACLVYTIDDNLLDLKVYGLARSALSDEQAAVLRYFSRQADGLIVSTEELKKRLLILNSTILVVPNSLDERLLDHHRPAHGGSQSKIIGYMGTHTHDADILMILQPLREILRKYQGIVRLQLIGGFANHKLIQAFTGLPVETISVGHRDEYPAFVRWMNETVAWDVGIAPLEDTPFARCKSDIKYLDYGSQAIAGVYSRVPAYQNTVKHLETGYLADNSVEAWREAFELLLNDDSLRIKLAENARADVISNRTLKQCATNWREAILSIMQNRRPPKRH